MTQNSRKELPSICLEVQQDLSAEFDNECQLLERTLINRHLDTCSVCTTYKSGLHSLHGQLQRKQSPICDVDEIWCHILNSIENDESVEPTSKTDQLVHKVSNRWLGFALAASILFGVITAGLLIDPSKNETLPLIAETVRDFETFQIRGELLDIDANKISYIVQWMSAKIDFELPDSTIEPPEGYSVHGGRLCSLLSRRSAFFYYEKESDMLSLYVMKADGLSVPHDGEYKTSMTQAGLTTVSWTRDDLAYVIVSDLSAEEVVKFASRS